MLCRLGQHSVSENLAEAHEARVVFFQPSIMSESIQIIDGGDDEVRCTKCSKLVAKVLPLGHFEVKCLRCGTLNELIEHADNL